MPQEPDASLGEALLLEYYYEEVPDYDEQQLAVAATTIAADLIRTAFRPSCVSQFRQFYPGCIGKGARILRPLFS